MNSIHSAAPTAETAAIADAVKRIPAGIAVPKTKTPR